MRALRNRARSLSSLSKQAFERYALRPPAGQRARTCAFSFHRWRSHLIVLYLGCNIKDQQTFSRVQCEGRSRVDCQGWPCIHKSRLVHGRPRGCASRVAAALSLCRDTALRFEAGFSESWVPYKSRCVTDKTHRKHELQSGAANYSSKIQPFLEVQGFGQFNEAI